MHFLMAFLFWVSIPNKNRFVLKRINLFTWHKLLVVGITVQLYQTHQYNIDYIDFKSI